MAQDVINPTKVQTFTNRRQEIQSCHHFLNRQYYSRFALEKQKLMKQVIHQDQLVIEFQSAARFQYHGRSERNRSSYVIKDRVACVVGDG